MKNAVGFQRRSRDQRSFNDRTKFDPSRKHLMKVAQYEVLGYAANRHARRARDDRNVWLLASHIRLGKAQAVNRSSRPGRLTFSERTTQHFVLGYFHLVPPGHCSHCVNGNLARTVRSSAANRPTWPGARTGSQISHSALRIPRFFIGYLSQDPNFSRDNQSLRTRSTTWRSQAK
jgi:hypothetical protein